ncbi:MAG: hypothetical protein MUF48_15575 [Pirellulaceae bacterium]|nr:hypothetical protein [Pirellulaceae bacterium]
MKRRTYGPGRRQRRCAPGGRVATRRRQVGFEQLEARRLLATSVWDGGGDGRTWLDPLNWSDRQVPSAGTDVLIPNVAATSIINLPTSGTLRLNSLQSAEHLVLSGATLSLDTPSTLARLTMSGGTLSGTGEVTVTGLFDWRGGTITSTDPASVITLAGGLEMTSGTRVLSGRTLVLASDTQWTGGTWQINGHATIINRPGAVLSFASTWLDDTGANTTDTLINEGTLRKNSGAGTATLEFDLFDLRAGLAHRSAAGNDRHHRAVHQCRPLGSGPGGDDRLAGR